MYTAYAMLAVAFGIPRRKLGLSLGKRRRRRRKRLGSKREVCVCRLSYEAKSYSGNIRNADLLLPFDSVRGSLPEKVSVTFGKFIYEKEKE